MIKDSESLKLLHALNNNKINIPEKIRGREGAIKSRKMRKIGWEVARKSNYTAVYKRNTQFVDAALFISRPV